MKNQIQFTVWGRYALFTDPLTRVGGEKFSYQIPTVQALKGICESIYWKPTFNWVIDSIRIMNPIRMQAQGIRPLVYGGTNTLSYYTYLVDPEYEVNAHFEWNLNRDDLEHDRNEGKHFNIAIRMLEKGGRRDIFLGTRECQGYVEPVIFGKKKSFYDTYDEIQFDLMYHSLIYPSESGVNALQAVFHSPLMKKSEIILEKDLFSLPKKYVKDMEYEIIATSGSKEFDVGGGI